MGLRTTVAAATLLPLAASGIMAATSTASAAPHTRAHLAAPRPPRVTNLAPYLDGATVTLGWHNPDPALFRRDIVRLSPGATAPATPKSGTAVPLGRRRATTATLAALTRAHRYSAAVWVRDAMGRLSPRTATTFVVPRRAPHRTGTISGTVRDAHGAPLSGVQVDVYSRTDFAEAGETVTDASGNYRLVVPAGPVFVDYGGADAQGGNSDATGYVDNFRSVTAVAHRNVSVTVTLHAGAEITGMATDQLGDPLADVAVYAVPATNYVEPDAAANYSGIFVSYSFLDGEAVTGSDGRFALKGVSAADTEVCLDPNADTDYGDTVNGPVQRCIDPPQELHAGQSLDVGTTTLTSAPRGNLAGRVVAADGTGVAGGSVYVVPTGRRYPVGYTQSDEDGNYEITGLKEGTYRVCVDALDVESASGLGYLSRCRATRVSVVAGRTSDRKRVVLYPGGSLSGVVRAADGAPVRGASVMVDRGRYWVTTDATGHWDVEGLRSGRYRVCVDGFDAQVTGHPGGVRGACTGTTGFVVRRGRNRVGADFSLADAAAIRGTVVAGPGQPLGGVDVDVERRTPHSLTGYSVSTGPHGHFVIDGLPAGKYHLCFDDEPLVGGWLSGCADHPVFARTGRVSNSGTQNFDATGSITTAVTDSSGTPLAGVDVAVVEPCHARFSCDRSPLVGQRFRVAASWVTGRNGTVRLPHLRPGSYQVCLFGYLAAPVSGATPPTGYADGCASAGFDVAVTNGHDTAVTGALAQAGAVSGTITDTTGAPLVGVLVHVTGSAADNAPQSPEDLPPFEDSVFSQAVTAADGSYVVRSVAPGNQTVCVRPDPLQLNPTRFTKQCYGGQPGGTTGTPVPVTAGQVTSGIDLTVQRTG